MDAESAYLAVPRATKDVAEAKNEGRAHIKARRRNDDCSIEEVKNVLAMWPFIIMLTEQNVGAYSLTLKADSCENVFISMALMF